MKILSLLLTAFLLVPLFAESVPEWHKKAEKAFPSAKYIRAEGEGSTAKSAKSDAVSQISLYFETKSTVVTEAVESASQIISNDSAKVSLDKDFVSVSNVQSAADFFCLSFTDVFHDEKHDKYYVMAYIDKAESALIFTSRINALEKAISGYKDYAKSEKEPFLSLNALHSAKVLAELCERYIKSETLINPSDVPKFQGLLESLATLGVEYTERKKDVSFSIEMKESDKRYDPLFVSIAESLEKRGFVFSPVDALYNIVVSVSCIEETYEAGTFVRPSLEIVIVNKAKKGVYTYSATLPRTTGKTLEQAYTRVVGKLKANVEENFLKE